MSSKFKKSGIFHIIQKVANTFNGVRKKLFLIITDLGDNNTLDKLLIFTSKRSDNIACGFNHRSVNSNDFRPEIPAILIMKLTV